MSQHTFVIGDLVTAPRMRDWDGTLLVCRIGQSQGDEHALFPINGGALPRAVASKDLTLVAAWSGPALSRWNETKVLADDQPG